jgi:hypothetical protein
MQNLRTELKRCQPYFIEKELLPKLYFKEDEKNTEYWVFKYSFITRISDEAIGVRLGYTRQHIYCITKNILQANKCLVTNFLETFNK